MRKLQLIRHCIAIALILVINNVGYSHYAIDNDTFVDNVSQLPAFKRINSKIKTIVIDPGHGGKDPGCIGSLYQEKDIALALAMKFGHLVKMHYPEINVIFTRSDDRFVPLYKRIKIANQADADLFVSIHCNWFKDRTIHGTETFVMGLHTVDENLEVAKRENAAIIFEQDFEKNYDGYEPNSPLGHIMLSNYQNAYLNRSLAIADYVEDNLAHRTNKLSRGVKQAGFVVLRQATMPSILVEAGFLSNENEEKYLGSQRGQHEIAYSLLNSVEMYMQDEDDATTLLVDTTPPPAIKLANQVTTPSPRVSDNHQSQVSLKEHSIAKVVAEQPTKKAEPLIMYSVQVAASIGKPMKQTGDKWQSLKHLEIEQKDGYFKYYDGSFDNMADANTHKLTLESVGFNGAFLVKR